MTLSVIDVILQAVNIVTDMWEVVSPIFAPSNWKLKFPKFDFGAANRALSNLNLRNIFHN